MHTETDLVFKQTANQQLKLDLYLPAHVRGPRPTVVWVAGGGWAQMGKEGCKRLAAWLTDYGFAVAGIEYRVSAQAPFPAQIQDCKAAVRWLRAHAAQHGLDRRRFGAWGDSAGGHLVELLGTTARIAAFEGENVHPNESSEMQAVCSFCGPSDLADLPGAAQEVTQLLGAAPEDDPQRTAWASPLYHVNEDSAPHLLAHGDQDTLVPISHSYRYLSRLQQFGIEASLYVRRGVGHEGIEFYGYEQLRLKVAEFFASHLLSR
jgi:acetyl esterase/lipase